MKAKVHSTQHKEQEPPQSPRGRPQPLYFRSVLIVPHFCEVSAIVLQVRKLLNSSQRKCAVRQLNVTLLNFSVLGLIHTTRAPRQRAQGSLVDAGLHSNTTTTTPTHSFTVGPAQASWPTWDAGQKILCGPDEKENGGWAKNRY